MKKIISLRAAERKKSPRILTWLDLIRFNCLLDSTENWQNPNFIIFGVVSFWKNEKYLETNLQDSTSFTTNQGFDWNVFFPVFCCDVSSNTMKIHGKMHSSQTPALKPVKNCNQPGGGAVIIRVFDLIQLDFLTWLDLVLFLTRLDHLLELIRLPIK